MTGISRRGFIGTVASAGTAAIIAPSVQSIDLPAGKSMLELAKDENFWRSVAAQYDATPAITNLENGYWGIMSKPVLAEYQRLTEWVNKRNTYYARFDWGNANRQLHESVAKFLNVDASEIVLTRGATEALQALIGGYNKLSPGDTVLYADLDYSEMKRAMRWLADRRKVTPVKINFPEPTKDKELTEADIIQFYQEALDANPKTKLLLLTHLNNWTGLIPPVKRIADMAKARGIDVILDAAHSVGQVDFDIAGCECDFVGVNLHKWVGAPIGCGVIYIKNGRVMDIDPYMGHNPESDKVSDRIDTGTLNFAAHMAIPAAIQFHDQMGTALKETRLRYLRDIWVEEARKLDGLTVLTPDNPKMVAGLTSFRLDGVTSTEANNALMKTLADDYGVLTTRRTGPAAGDCIRVTPSFYNSADDMMKLADALKKVTT